MRERVGEIKLGFSIYPRSSLHAKRHMGIKFLFGVYYVNMELHIIL